MLAGTRAHTYSESTDSAADTGRGTSMHGVGYAGGVDMSSHDDSMSLSLPGVVSGEGDGSGSGRERSLTKLKGALWGRGEMSIESGAKPGDDEGIGGVVTPSQRVHGVEVSRSSVLGLCTWAIGGEAYALTPCVQLLKEIGSEERPAGRGKLGAATKHVSTESGKAPVWWW